MQDLHSATVCALRATKVTPQALDQAISTFVVQERHLWLNLTEMRDEEKVHFLDAPISKGCFSRDTVKDFAQQLSTVKMQTEAIKHILAAPCEGCTGPTTIWVGSSTPKEVISQESSTAFPSADCEKP